MDDTTRTDNWKGEEWAGEPTATPTDATPTEQWNKEQYVGDRGDGAPAPQDPDTMPEGETTISGNRHPDGEEHWAPGEPVDATTRR